MADLDDLVFDEMKQFIRDQLGRSHQDTEEGAAILVGCRGAALALGGAMGLAASSGAADVRAAAIRGILVGAAAGLLGYSACKSVQKQITGFQESALAENGSQGKKSLLTVEEKRELNRKLDELLETYRSGQQQPELVA